MCRYVWYWANEILAILVLNSFFFLLNLVRCVKCPDTSFGVDSEINEHMGNHHPKLFQVHRCNFCSFGTQKLTDLIFHKKSAHPTIPHFYCQDCFTRFFTRKELRSHVSQEHPEHDRYDFIWNFNCIIFGRYHFKQYLDIFH